MAEAKTRKTDASVEEFLDRVSGDARRADSRAVCALMRAVTGTEPAMWGSGIVGFGEYRYTYGTGKQASWPAVGFSPRKQAITLYLAEGVEPYRALLAGLGPHTAGKGCLYLKRLSDVDEQVLRELIRRGFEQANGRTVTRTTRRQAHLGLRTRRDALPDVARQRRSSRSATGPDTPEPPFGAGCPIAEVTVAVAPELAVLHLRAWPGTIDRRALVTAVRPL